MPIAGRSRESLAAPALAQLHSLRAAPSWSGAEAAGPRGAKALPQVCAPARLLPEVGVNSAEKTQIKAALRYLTTPQPNLKRLSHPVLVLPTAGTAQGKEMIGAPRPWSGLAPVLRLHRADGAGRGTSSAPVPREHDSLLPAKV